MVPQIFKRMKMPLNDKMKYVQKLVGLHMRPIAMVDDIVTDSAVRRMMFEAGEDIDDLMLLCEADITSKNREKKERYLQNFQVVRQKMEELRLKDHRRNFQPIVDGNEIMQMFGLTPSREVGVLKDALKNAILDDNLPDNREAEIAFLVEKAETMGLRPIL
jgi:poly(A) polymerase